MALNIIFLISLLYIFTRSKNLIITLLTFFTIMYCAQVLFVEQVYGVGFSRSQDKFDSFDQVRNAIMIFYLVVAIPNYRINTNIKYPHRFRTFKYEDLLIFIFVAGLALYLLFSKGIRIDGSFGETVGIRSIVEDYIALPIIVSIVVSRGRWLVVVSVLMMALSYLLAGERMRMFVYLVPLFFVFGGKQSSIGFKIALFGVLAFAELISFLRSGVMTFGLAGDYKVTHFGSVTISSMYLLDYTEGLPFFEKARYVVGIIVGNIIPSKYLPEAFDIKRDLFLYAEIPGGGWLPVWISALVGYWGLGLFSLISALVINVYSKQIVPLFLKRKTHIFISYIVFVTTLPRWYMYTPYQIIRFPLYAGLICYIYLKIGKRIRLWQT